jgi:hypothetical protein
MFRQFLPHFLIAGATALVLAACEPSPPPVGPCLPGNDGCEPIFMPCSADNPCAEGFDCASDGTCVAACPAGTVGCSCDLDAARECGDGLTCDADSVCVDPECPLGLQGCACNTDGTCAPGPFGVALACQAGICDVIEDDSEEPGMPSADCYTPCSQSLTMPDGTFRYCSDDGLMEGCIAGLECVQGSCVGDGELPGACSDAVDCPSHQTCIGDLCLSNCDLDSDCSDGTACHERVCRSLCTSTSSSCANGFICNTSDGVDGVCMPQVDVDLDAPDTPGLPFEVSVNDLAFTNNRISNFFEITNNSDRAEDFVVKKVEHTEITIDGRQVDNETPLFWMEMGEVGAEALGDEYMVEILPGETVTVSVTEAFNETIDRWEGRIVVVNDRLGEHPIRLEYSTQPEGQWSGSIYYFINFDDADIDNWIDKISNPNVPAPDKRTAADQTQNAFVRKWTDFRTNPLFTQRNFDAVVRSTLDGAWQYAGVQEACDEQFSQSAFALCYLFADGSPGDDGIEIYTDDEGLRVPTGVMEMPYTIRLKSGQGTYAYNGRVETPYSLQYPGLPPVELEFARDPQTCEDDSAETCLAPLKTFKSDVLVGGRYLTDGGCAEATFEEVEVPWLVPHFVEGTVQPEGSPRVRKECRESTFPYDSATSLGKKQNTSLAGANPLPDGRVRRRSVELMDGVMINSKTLLLLVRETFSANLASDLPAADFSAYGLVQLQRGGDDIDADGYAPGIIPDQMTLPEPDDKMNLGCTDDLVESMLGIGEELDTAAEYNEVALRLLTGAPVGVLQPPELGTTLSHLHYLCHDTGRIDGARGAWTTPEECPLGSRVTYFFWDDDGGNEPYPSELEDCAGDPANRCLPGAECPAEQRGNCELELAAIEAADDLADPRLRLNPAYACTDDGTTVDPDAVVCSDDRFDLRADKLFYDPGLIPTGVRVDSPLATEIDDAFRFKTRFRSRTGKTIGFVPAVCENGGDAIPYCYDPQRIEEVRTRMDCLVHLYSEDLLEDGLQGDAESLTGEFLERNFSFYFDNNGNFTGDGFERLYAELLIMLGDEALTDAVASRFDLAGTSIALFQGDLLEPDGIRLSGGAGFEMLLLYRAQQYYQLVLDRFYRESPALWAGLEDPTQNFISIESISTYFNRLILASTKKARAASEIARRYQAFNRADLARHVIERSYTEAYLESIALSQFMRRSVRVVDADEVDQLRFELNQAQRQYRRALRQMRETYQGLTDEITFFGDPPDYVPFPASGRFDVPSVRLMLDRAQETLQVAKEREERALTSNRAFDVDAAQFQAELARIRIQYDNDLAELCGDFEGQDGHIYPAIPAYAAKSPITQIIGNPCGLMGNGNIYDSVANLEARKLDLRAEIQDIRDVYERVRIEEERILDECAGRVAIADIRFEAADRTATLNDEINAAQNEIAAWEKELSELDRGAQVASAWGQVSGSVASALGACSGVVPGAACIAAGIAGGVAAASYTAAATTQSVALGVQISANESITAKENSIRTKEKEIADLNAGADYQAAVGECCLDPGLTDPDINVPLQSCADPGPLMVNSDATVKGYMIDLMRSRIEASRADVEVQRAIGVITSMNNRAVRLMAQQEETEQHLINVEAARNDPNVRIYANADVLDADKSFRDGLVDAFRATRMFEYYTAQSYAAKEDLFLVRMAGRGEGNLEDYLLDLKRAFNDFEQTFGNPSLRVQLVSLRDDIFRIPEIDGQGRALSPAERTDSFRERLTDVGLLDDRGYIRVPFSTVLTDTSPLTSIHKLAYVEAELQGSDVGDRLGRVYLTARGTSTIRDLEGDQLYYRMDPVTAVVNPFFNGVRVFDNEVYRNDRLKDRPLVNSLWELTLNLRDEQVNEDVNVNSITDVRLFFFYEDFTQL